MPAILWVQGTVFLVCVVLLSIFAHYDGQAKTRAKAEKFGVGAFVSIVSFFALFSGW